MSVFAQFPSLFCSLQVSWGDDKVNQYNLNVAAGRPYSFDHVYQQTGTYEIKAIATVRRQNANAHEWWKISEQHQSWDVAQQELITTVGIREGCEDALSRVGVDAIDGMSQWFDNAIANALQLDPLQISTCRRVGEEEVVLSAASLSSGFLSLVVDWGDEKTHQKGMNVRSGTPYAFTHTYERAGNYQVTAKAYVRRLSQDRTAWEYLESEMTTTVNVRNECVFINRAGIDIMGDWYENMLDSAILFKPLNPDTCRGVGKEATTLTIASASSGYMVLNVDWGTGNLMQYGVNIATGAPVEFSFVYHEPGTYNIKADVKVRRLNVDKNEWEVLKQSFETTVKIHPECPELQQDGMIAAIPQDVCYQENGVNICVSYHDDFSCDMTVDGKKCQCCSYSPEQEFVSAFDCTNTGIERASMGECVIDDATATGTDDSSNEDVSAFTVVDYYYTVETTPDGSPDTFASEIESGINDGVAGDVSLSGIGAITSRPADSELTECKCIHVCCLVFLLNRCVYGGRSVVLVGALYSLVIHSYIYLFSPHTSLLKYAMIDRPPHSLMPPRRRR